MYNDSLFNAFARSFEARSETDMSMAEYLESCRNDPMRYANAAERLLAAIGEPQMIDTAKDPRLGRIFLNRTIRSYPAFAGFYGMEDTIERIVGFFRHAFASSLWPRALAWLDGEPDDAAPPAG